MPHENPLEIFPYGDPPPPLPTGKLGKLTPLPPGKSDPFGGGMDIFCNHTIFCARNFCGSYYGCCSGVLPFKREGLYLNFRVIKIFGVCLQINCLQSS